MEKLSFDLNVRKESSDSDEAAQYGGNPKSVSFEIHHGGCFTPTPNGSYVGGQVSSVDVVDIDEFCLDYGLHPLTVDVDVLELEKYVKDSKIILMYVEHGSTNVDLSIFVTPKKGVAIPADKRPIVVETNDPFDDFDKILGDYANTRKEIIFHVEDLNYDPKHDEVFDDDEHILEDVSVTLVPFVGSDTAMGKNVFSQTKGGLVIRENNISGKQNFFDKEKTVKGKGKKVNEQNKEDKYSCHWTMLVAYINKGRWEVRTLIKDHKCLQSREIDACASRFLSDHVIKTLATNPDIPVRHETWAHVYLFKINPCNGKEMWLVVESRLVIISPIHKPQVSRPPKKRNKSNDELARKDARVKVVQVKLVVLVNRVKEQEKLLVQGISLVKLLVLVNRVKECLKSSWWFYST
ncbi:hypothetical protein Tco_0966340 [Tanacetum coccineum]